MIVRLACRDDAAGIAAVHVRSWQGAYKGLMPDDYLASLSIADRTSGWEKALALADTDVWVAEEDGRVLGWVTVASSRDVDAPVGTAELWAINVDPTAWGRGVGKALWQQVRQHLASTTYSRITLWVLQDNLRALRFYESIGFVSDDGTRRTIEIGGAPLVELRLRRDL